jgi:hypothetical protein
MPASTSPFAPERREGLRGCAKPINIIVSERVAVTAGARESVTRAVKVKLPAAVGVPLIVPVVELSVSPAGRLPAAIDQEYGLTPPEAASVWL